MKTSMQTISDAISEHFGISEEVIFSRTRLAKIVWARQIFHYKCTRYTARSLSAIGAFYSNIFDHATVLHSRNRIKDLLYIRDEKTLKDIEAIDEIIKRNRYIDCDIIPIEVNLLEKAVL